MTLPFRRHCPSTSWIWVESTTPARSTLPSAATSASVPRIGAEVITGDAGAGTRRSAPPITFAIRWAIFAPRFGEIQVRTIASPTRIGSVATLPDAETLRFFQSCAKSSWKRIATPVDWTMTMTFSSRVHEFIRPVRRACPHRISISTTYLSCIDPASLEPSPSRTAATRSATVRSSVGEEPAGARRPRRRCSRAER